MKNKYLLLILLLLSSVFTKNFAQVLVGDTSFWFAAPDLEENNICGPGDSPMMLLITNGSTQPAHVTIKLYNNGSPVITTQTILPNNSWKYDIPSTNKSWIENPRSLAGQVANYGVYISSDVKITAYYQVLPICNQDLFALKGNAALGTLFYVPMIHDSYYYTDVAISYPNAYDQIDIVATENNTEVRILPTAEIKISGGTSPAGTEVVRILNKGQTLKIMEAISLRYAGSASLGGTRIVADKPIAVTTTEDLIGRTAVPSTGADVIGDQIVPVNSLGKKYAVIKGFMIGSERLYMIATANGTTISINNGSTTTTSPVLNAGNCWVFDMGNDGYSGQDPDVVTISANNPVYCYQVTGVCRPDKTNDELGSALLPSIYSICQMQLSFFSYEAVTSDYNNLFLLFRTGSENDFTLSYGSTTIIPPITTMPVPGMPDWKAAKYEIPDSFRNQVVTIKNTSSMFAMGYFSINNITGGASFGYLSNFGTFSLPDTTYKCEGSSITLDGGYAKSYLWTLPDGTHDTTPTIVVSDEGMYSITVDQDPFIIMDSTVVIDRFSGSFIVSSGHDVGGGNYTYTVDLNGQMPSNVIYTWKIDSIIVATDNVFNIAWTDSSEKIITVELTDTILNCTKILSITHYKLLDNISDADCLGNVSSYNWGMENIYVSSQQYSAYFSPLIGDVTGDGIPNIIVAVSSDHYNSTEFHVLNGTDYSYVSKINTAMVRIAEIGPAAIAKIVNKYMFYVWIESDQKIRAYNITTNSLEWISSVIVGNAQTSAVTVSLADFDNDGIPEVYAGNKIFDAITGDLIWSGQGNDGKLNLSDFNLTTNIIASFASDVIGDARLELIAGNQVYDVVINRVSPLTNVLPARNVTPPIFGAWTVPNDGLTQVVDINNDGYLDICISRHDYLGNRSVIYVWDPRKEEIIASNHLTSSGYMSYPFIGDIDGDGRPDIIVVYQNGPSSGSSGGYMQAFKYVNNNTTLQPVWSSPYPISELWARTGITLFDFNQDMINEIVYRDMTLLRVIDGSGSTPVNKITFNCHSGTGYEYPVIADVNNDGMAEVITVGGTTNNNNTYLQVFSATNTTKWAPARKVWNQYAYNAVNVNEDLTIPRYQLNPATIFPGTDGILGTADDVRPYNGYLMQQTMLNKNGMPLWLAADATFAGTPLFNYSANGDSLLISLQVTNIGETSLQNPFHISIYKNKVAIANKLITDSITKSINPNDTFIVDIVVRNINSYLPIDTIIIRLNDNGQASFVQQECDTSNNTFIKEFLDLLATTIQDSNCYGYKYDKNGFDFIALHDTIVSIRLTASDGSDSLVRLYLHVFDTSLFVFFDTIHAEESFYNKFGFYLPADSLNYTGTHLYTVKFISSFGCDSTHFLYLTKVESYLFSDTITICQHADGMWRNKPLQTSVMGTFIVWDSLKTAQGYDSLYRLMLIIQPDYLFEDTLTVCLHEVANWRNIPLTTSITGTFIVWDSLQTSTYGCDSLYRLTLIVLPTYLFNDTLLVCHHATASWRGILLPTSVAGTFIFWDSLKTSHYGCDSIYSLTLFVNVIPDFEIKTTGDLCNDESIRLFVDLENVSYLWTTGDTTPYTTVSQNGVYGISVSIVGCTTLQDIHVECPCDMWLPNIFTPNNDQYNEEFIPVSSSVLSSFSMYIYDRWGSLIYQTETLTPWNGRYKGGDAVAGVYYCVIHYTCKNDPTKIWTKQGSVTLIR